MFVLAEEDQELFDRVQEQNLTRQYGLLTNSIEIGLTKGSGAFDKFLLWALNHAAVANISQFGYGSLPRTPGSSAVGKPGSNAEPHVTRAMQKFDRAPIM